MSAADSISSRADERPRPDETVALEAQLRELQQEASVREQL
jgi:hypothetical protein